MREYVRECAFRHVFHYWIQLQRSKEISIAVCDIISPVGAYEFRNNVVINNTNNATHVTIVNVDRIYLRKLWNDIWTVALFSEDCRQDAAQNDEETFVKSQINYFRHH